MSKARIAVVLGTVTLALAGAMQAQAAPSPGLLRAPAQAAVPAVATPAYAGADIVVDPPQIAQASVQAVQARMSTTVARATPPAHEIPVYSQLLGAGDAVLTLDKSAKQQRGDVPAAPLPGAIWLFGSALLAFLWIAGRRRL